MTLQEKAASYLARLCLDIPSRRVGSAGNRAATAFFAHTIASFGFDTCSTPFDCLDWQEEGVDLTAGADRFEACASPYSLGCRALAPLTVASTPDELEAAQVGERILLLRGELTREQLMPKSFPFYNPDHHRRTIRLLEERQPQAIVAATARDQEMVGSQYPFPLFEDGDFDIPSVYMTDVEGDRLAAHAGREVWLESRATRIPSRGENVTARKGSAAGRRIVLFAHIDARMGSPGAGDNASGVAVLLVLAELLAGYSGGLDIELVALNGEDYYSNPGEQLWLAANAGRFGDILLGINLDDVGYHRGRIAYSLYDCPPAVEAGVRGLFAAVPVLTEGEPWVQGDHGLFLMNQVPALAFTSECLAELMAGITHTPNDRPELLDPARLVTLAHAIRGLVLALDQAR